LADCIDATCERLVWPSLTGILAINFYPDYSAAPSPVDGCATVLNRH